MSAARGIDSNAKTRMLTELRRSAGTHWKVIPGTHEDQTIQIGPLVKDVVIFNPTLPIVFMSQSETSAKALVSAYRAVQKPRRTGPTFYYVSLFTGKEIAIPMDDLKTLREAKGASGSLAKLGKYDAPCFTGSRRLGLIERWGTRGKDAEQAALTQEGESALYLWHLMRNA